MADLIQQLVNKMGLYDVEHVLEKSTELLRLLELRSTNVPLQINAYAKVVICIDLAAAELRIGIDEEQALRLAGIRKTQYANFKRMFEKLLGLGRLLGVNDICIRLGLNEVSKKATELLELYKKVNAASNADMDVNHPQYAAVAVFFACKILKQKPPKQKLMPMSNLRPSQWQQLEQRWEKFMAKHYKDAMDNKLQKQQQINEDEKNIEDSKDKKSSPRNEVEDYENWKRRMLSMAEAKLQQQAKQGDKENMILGI